MPDKSTAAPKPADIAAFAATIITHRGQPAGICIKFRRFDGASALVHLTPQENARLLGALKEYMERGRHEGLMFQFYDNPALAEVLADSHPYNTLLSMAPPLASEEAGEARKATTVVKSTFADRGSHFVYRAGFADGSTAEFSLHECVAFNVWGFITKMEQDSRLLFGHHSVGRA